jgi:hypothetical protein
MKTIGSDLEFYCYLKANLPSGYTIVSEPSADYYSEWQFCYKIYKGSQLLWDINGDFSDLQEGELTRRAENILAETGRKYDYWK